MLRGASPQGEIWSGGRRTKYPTDMLSFCMKHQEFEPPEELRDVVKCFWYNRRDLGEGAAGFEVIPDGYAEIIFHFGGLWGVPDGGGLLWARLRQPVHWDSISKALAGTPLHAMPGKHFSLHGRFQHHLALGWTGDDPVELQIAVDRLAQVAGHP